MVPVGCPETTVRNYHYSLLNNPEQRSSQIRTVCNNKRLAVQTAVAAAAIRTKQTYNNTVTVTTACRSVNGRLCTPQSHNQAQQQFSKQNTQSRLGSIKSLRLITL